MQVVWESLLAPTPFFLWLSHCYTTCCHFGVDMKLGARQELLVWAGFLALGIGPFLSFPGFHGNALEPCLYWLWHLSLGGIALWFMLSRRGTSRPRWLTAVGATVMFCVCLIAALYFMDWAAWYK